MSVAEDILEASILVVDDVPADARFVESILSAAGYSRITVVTDSRVVCDLHREHHYDLMVLDLVMPHRDGYEVMAELATIEHGACLPVLAVAAEPEQLSRALRAGARDFVAKPIRTAELLARVRNLLVVELAQKALERRGEKPEKALDERTASLRESEGLFRLFAERLPEAVWIRDAKERVFRYVSPKLGVVLGVHIDAGDPIDKAIDCTHPEDRPRVLKELQRLPQGGIDMEFRFVRPDGSERCGHTRTFAIADSSGAVKWVGGILEDVTESRQMGTALREAESGFRALVEQSITGIYMVENGVWTYVNPQLCEILGYPADELVGCPTLGLVVEEDRQRLQQNRAEAYAGKRRGLSDTYRLRRKDGAVVHLGLDSKYIDVGGRGEGAEFPVEVASRLNLGGKSIFVAFMENISEREKARSALDNANRRLQSLSDRVLTIQEEERRIISSELHDDVGQLLLALELGLHRLGQHSVQDRVELFTECLDLVTSVQEKIRQLSVRLHPPQLDQLGLGEAFRALVSRQRAATGLDIRCTLEGPERGELRPEVEIACYRICQEALSNATRHSNACVVEVRTKLEKDRFWMSVRDDGRGFDVVARSEAAHVAGNLGLASMEERARLAGGELELRTAPGAGTVVIAMFPRLVRAASAAAAA